MHVQNVVMETAVRAGIVKRGVSGTGESILPTGWELLRRERASDYRMGSKLGTGGREDTTSAIEGASGVIPSLGNTWWDGTKDRGRETFHDEMGREYPVRPIPYGYSRPVDSHDSPGLFSPLPRLPNVNQAETPLGSTAEGRRNITTVHAPIHRQQQQ